MGDSLVTESHRRLEASVISEFSEQCSSNILSNKSVQTTCQCLNVFTKNQLDEVHNKGNTGALTTPGSHTHKLVSMTQKWPTKFSRLRVSIEFLDWQAKRRAMRGMREMRGMKEHLSIWESIAITAMNQINEKSTEDSSNRSQLKTSVDLHREIWIRQFLLLLGEPSVIFS